ncbi:MAG: hypothetical protein GY777_17700 [Candidatus Brocadiaceae bacterium]|nr:hypothetical protein [Candidatus Brocadiaceae bacterium]
MSILDLFRGMDATEIEELFNSLDDALDDYFGEHGERRRFILACRKLSHEDIAIIQRVMTGTYQDMDYDLLADDIVNPLRAADAILMLESELEKTKEEGFLEFLLALVKKDKVATKLNRGRFIAWEYPLLENKKTPAKFIEFLWDINKNGKYKKLDNYEMIRDVAKHPNCSTRVLKELLEVDDDPAIRRAIARHANINDELTDFFLNSSRVSEREELVRSKFITEEALLSLMRDKFDRISNVARKQFKKRFPDKRVTDKAIDAAVKKRIEKPYVKPSKPERKFCKYEDGRMGIDHIKSLKSSQRAAVISNTSADIVEALVNDSSKAVRRAVAASRHCPENALRNYLEEPDMVIVNKALQSLTLLHPNASCEDLLSDEAISESYELLNTYINEKGNFDPLWSGMDAKTESEVERINLIAQFSNNPMMHQRIVGDLTGIPEGRTRWNLLQKLSNNLYISDKVIKKIALEIGFGSENVLKRCANKEIIEEYLADPTVPGGVRSRLEAHAETLS